MTIDEQPELDLGLGIQRETVRAKRPLPTTAIPNLNQPIRLSSLRFEDPNRPLSCLEVDFPIGPVNIVSQLEQNDKKLVYQMGKWWARRQSSIFRALLIAASTKAPADIHDASRIVWESYYANHMNGGSFAGLRVLDPFMGGGTTVLEAARLGFTPVGVDLNPVAWFVSKTELSREPVEDVRLLLNYVEQHVRPQIEPYAAIDCPRGHRGRWYRVDDAACPFDVKSANKLGYRLIPQPETFSIFAVEKHNRCYYRYDGPQTLYTFWVKHAPCERCQHLTPVLRSLVLGWRTLIVRFVPMTCRACQLVFDWEFEQARIAPNATLIVSSDETPYVAPLKDSTTTACPGCGVSVERPPAGVKPSRKKIRFTVMIHPDWLGGAANTGGAEGLGGWAGAPLDAERRWTMLRAQGLMLIEVRGDLPTTIPDPMKPGVSIDPHHGTGWRKAAIGPDGSTVVKEVPSSFTCSSCGTGQDFLTSVKKTGHTAPAAQAAIHGYCPTCDSEQQSYRGRFWKTPDVVDHERWIAAATEWESVRSLSVGEWVPDETLPFSHMTHEMNGGIPNWGYTHWWKMFNPRQLLILSQLVDAIVHAPDKFGQRTRELALLAFQQYLRKQNMFCFWQAEYDKAQPFFSNNDYRPKTMPVETNCFGEYGSGNWSSCVENVLHGVEWIAEPWEKSPSKGQYKSERIWIDDPAPVGADRELYCASATDLSMLGDRSIDLVITDPPFGNNVFYADLSDFFYAWLRRPLGRWYPDIFVAPDTNKIQEAISNPAEHPDERTRDERKAGVEAPADAFYRETLTECWRESGRVLKDGGLLAFTFHHSEDEAWVGVLRSLFDAGFVLVATYPIRSDESKGENAAFGARKIEFDIIHVCRKRLDTPTRQSWRKMRDWVKDELERLHGLLQHYQEQQLSAPDIRVILRGKALEFYSRHYGQVFTGEGEPLDVRQALIGINAILDEETLPPVDRPPDDAEPLTRLYLRFFKDRTEIPRDDIYKQLQGTGATISQLTERGWVVEENRQVRIEPIQARFEKLRRRPRAEMKTDLDQAHFLIGAAMPGAKVVIRDELTRGTFALKPSVIGLLRWISVREEDEALRTAAGLAATLVEAAMRDGGGPVQMPLPGSS